MCVLFYYCGWHKLDIICVKNVIVSEFCKLLTWRVLFITCLSIETHLYNDILHYHNKAFGRYYIDDNDNLNRNGILNQKKLRYRLMLIHNKVFICSYFTIYHSLTSFIITMRLAIITMMMLTISIGMASWICSKEGNLIIIDYVFMFLKVWRFCIKIIICIFNTSLV